MANYVVLNDSNFEQEVLNSEIPVVVDFWAEWCAPCRIIAPLVEELANELDDLRMKFEQQAVDLKTAYEQIDQGGSDIDEMNETIEEHVTKLEEANRELECQMKAHPGPKDILLLAEVWDTTAAFDRHTKLPLYARHGIPEAWLIDLPAGVLAMHREPAEGVYTRLDRLGPQGSLRRTPARHPGWGYRPHRLPVAS